MPDKRVAPLFLELGERLETADGRKVLKAFLVWLADSVDDKTYTKSQLLQQLERLTAPAPSPVPQQVNPDYEHERAMGRER